MRVSEKVSANGRRMPCEESVASGEGQMALLPQRALRRKQNGFCSIRGRHPHNFEGWSIRFDVLRARRDRSRPPAPGNAAHSWIVAETSAFSVLTMTTVSLSGFSWKQTEKPEGPLNATVDHRPNEPVSVHQNLQRL
jgi:hypothetical protein